LLTIGIVAEAGTACTRANAAATPETSRKAVSPKAEQVGPCHAGETSL